MFFFCYFVCCLGYPGSYFEVREICLVVTKGHRIDWGYELEDFTQQDTVGLNIIDFLSFYLRLVLCKL